MAGESEQFRLSATQRGTVGRLCMDTKKGRRSPLMLAPSAAALAIAVLTGWLAFWVFFGIFVVLPWIAPVLADALQRVAREERPWNAQPHVFQWDETEFSARGDQSQDHVHRWSWDRVRAVWVVSRLLVLPHDGETGTSWIAVPINKLPDGAVQDISAIAERHREADRTLVRPRIDLRRWAGALVLGLAFGGGSGLAINLTKPHHFRYPDNAAFLALARSAELSPTTNGLSDQELLADGSTVCAALAHPGNIANVSDMDESFSVVPGNGGALFNNLGRTLTPAFTGFIDIARRELCPHAG